MYSKELEELIENVLADGVITEQERAVLRKRAQACGEDPDEVMVVVEGRLTKAKKAAKPANEKRGNVVHCPACGALVEAGSGKCAECGYVFTNVETNSSAERFAKELAALMDKRKSDKEIKEFVKSFPIPTSKEDMLEFIASMDARRRNQSDFQGAYSTKYKECVTKAKIQFAGDTQIGALLAQTEKFSMSKMTKSQKRMGGCAIVFLIFFYCIYSICVWLNNPSDFGDHSQDTVKMEQIDKQYDDLCEQVDNLPVPTESNYDECVLNIKRINWKKVSDRHRDGLGTEEYEEDVMDKASAKVNSYIEILHSIHMEYIDENGNATDESEYFDENGDLKRNSKDPKYVKKVDF